MIDYNIIFTACLGSAGLFGLIQFLFTRHDRKKDSLLEIKRDILNIKNSQNDTNIRVTRMELLALIRNDPTNIDAILQVAEYYFIELDGNAYAHAVFSKWARENGVDTGWLPKIKKGVNHGKKE